MSCFFPFLTGLCLSLALQAPRAGGFPEGQAAITDLLVQDSPGLRWETYPLLRDLVQALPDEVRLWVAVADRSQVEGVQHVLRSLDVREGRARVVVAERSLSVWARDRLIVLERDGVRRYLSPTDEREETDSSGEGQVAQALTKRIGNTVADRLPFALEGGNVIGTQDLLLVGANALERSFDEGCAPDVESRERRLVNGLGVPVAFLGRGASSPHVHLDMFVTVVGRRSVLLGDPAWGAAFLDAWERSGVHESVLPHYDDWSVRAQRESLAGYEAVLRDLRDLGFEVSRIPILHGEGGSRLTWNNALVERRAGEVRAYVPVHGLPDIDRAALEVYRAQGCRVFPVDASRLMHRGGAVRCVTNVLGWREDRDSAGEASGIRR
ncbi:MAG: hypothetical protein H6834_08865 [Planctomycetes bacterium]|nr:hypothetical protein [Planctomycetota bacterium]